MPKAGGLRVGLIFKTYESYLYAMSGGDFQNAGTFLKGLSRLVGVAISPVPLTKILYPSDALIWREYSEQNLDIVMVGVDKYLKNAGDMRNPFQMVRKGDDDYDATMEVETN